MELVKSQYKCFYSFNLCERVQTKLGSDPSCALHVPCGQVMLTSLECQFPHSVNGDILISVEGLLQELLLQQILTEPSLSARHHSKVWEIQP